MLIITARLTAARPARPGIQAPASRQQSTCCL